MVVCRGACRYEMRHAVDFYSVTFGFCGLTSQPCDFSPRIRQELAAWFMDESLTSTWIRATSPKTNCSRVWSAERTPPGSATTDDEHDTTVPYPPAAPNDEEFPAYTTCKAGRPDSSKDRPDRHHVS